MELEEQVSDKFDACNDLGHGHHEFEIGSSRRSGPASREFKKAREICLVYMIGRRNEWTSDIRVSQGDVEKNGSSSSFMAAICLQLHLKRGSVNPTSFLKYDTITCYFVECISAQLPATDLQISPDRRYKEFSTDERHVNRARNNPGHQFASPRQE